MTMGSGALQDREETAGCSRQRMGISSGVTFKRARLDHPGLRKQLRVEIPEPNGSPAPGHWARDTDPVVDEGLFLDNVGCDSLDATANVLEAEHGRWQLDHIYSSWSSPCTLPRPNDPDEDVDGDAQDGISVDTNEAAGPGDSVVMAFLIGGSGDGGEEKGKHQHHVNPSLTEPISEEAALEDERSLGIWLHGLQGPAVDLTGDDHATSLAREQPAPLAWAAAAVEPEEDAIVRTHLVEAPPPVAPDFSADSERTWQA
jgi:hypothetical protein